MTEVWEAFDQYLTARAPEDRHKEEVRRYRKRIYDILSSEFEIFAFFQSGSFQHGTAVMPYSDVDYIARLNPKDRPSSSTSILSRMRDLFRRELREASSVYVARPTVTINFSGILASYEITPAYLKSGSSDEDRVILIPAPYNRWREAAPQAHNKFVAKMDEKHSGEVRDIARLFKAWKYEHHVPISSFYLEMRCAEYAKTAEFISPLGSLRHIVGKLISTELAAMNDPTGLVSRITACSSLEKRTKCIALLRELRVNLDVAFDSWISGQDKWYELNTSLKAIWGEEFPYCEPVST